MEEKDNWNKPENWDIVNENQIIECENILNEKDIYRERTKNNSNAVLVLCAILFSILFVIVFILFLCIELNTKKQYTSEVVSTQMSNVVEITDKEMILDDIIENDIVLSNVKIGISYQAISQEISDIMRIPKGIRIISVDQKTDAFKKGLSKGDILTHIDNQIIESSEQIDSIINNKKLGDSILLTIYRMVDGSFEQITLDVNLEIDTSYPIRQ